ncbi:unnamed protein product [Parnassius apollo]|uniref:(apollo) hypothetical protein n=1 Tax=Parnassius apollo TaxID=110799 RepID=A0A8S3W445_PARAO|nr:unnamed protein product [Parnassius apollo]
MSFKDSKTTQELKLHRTKCTEIMKNVLMPHFRKELLDDIGNQKFRIIMDESTDVSVSIHLGLVIRDINPRPYLGCMFETAQYNLDSETLNAIRQRCTAFLLQLFKELQQRLPDNYKQLESMALLNPEEAIKPIKSNTIIDVAEILGFTPEIIGNL